MQQDRRCGGVRRRDRLYPDKIRQRGQQCAETDEQVGIGDEGRENHQRDTAEQRHCRPLFFAIEKEAQTDRAEHYAPEQLCRIHIGFIARQVLMLKLTSGSF